MCCCGSVRFLCIKLRNVGTCKTVELFSRQRRLTRSLRSCFVTGIAVCKDHLTAIRGAALS